jgi:uncharacterized membrane protein YeaQ/YmgE (transglycosylase-associated protein family)
MLQGMTLGQLLVVLLVGVVAGFLAGRVVRGGGFGLIGDLVVGIAGALIGWFLLGGLIQTYVLVPLGLAATSILGQIVVAAIGAVVLLAVLRLITGGRTRRRRRVFRI